jgi:hypothetical protein
MATVQPKRVFKIVEPLAGCVIPAVGEPAPGLEEHGRPEEAIAVPPMARTSRCTTEAQDACGRTFSILAVQRLGLFWTLQALALGRGLIGFQPWLDQGLLRIKMRQVGHQILDNP